MLFESAADVFGVKPSAVHYTNIYAVGLITGALFHIYSTKETFAFGSFLVYLVLAWVGSIYYYKVYETQ